MLQVFDAFDSHDMKETAPGMKNISLLFLSYSNNLKPTSKRHHGQDVLNFLEQQTFGGFYSMWREANTETTKFHIAMPRDAFFGVREEGPPMAYPRPHSNRNISPEPKSVRHGISEC